MRTYVVKPGDSPASIASRDDMAGCPKCCVDLIRANAPPKEIVVFPNGFISFKELHVGEELRLPNKWFEPRFDLLPPAYFASLPYHNGVTPSPFGNAALTILQDFKALDVAADALGALAAVDDQTFARRVGDVAETINASAQPALGISQHAQLAQDGVRAAALCSRMFATLLAAGLSTTKARAEVQDALASALNSAQRAMGEKYATVQPPEHR